MMDAGTLNKRTCGDDSLFVPGGPLTNRFLPDAITREKDAGNELPLAVLPPRTNARLAAQNGTFTLHGHGNLPIEAIPPSPEGEIRLARIAIDRSRICHLWHELQVLGVGRLGLFPDLGSVAAHVQWSCQSEQPVRQ
jgi:hypothetical protein